MATRVASLPERGARVRPNNYNNYNNYNNSTIKTIKLQILPAYGIVERREDGQAIDGPEGGLA